MLVTVDNAAFGAGGVDRNRDRKIADAGGC
jgi:hypothetical protein